MAITARQTKAATAVTSTGVTATFTTFATAAAGNLLVAAWTAPAPGTVTPPAGWTQALTDSAGGTPIIVLWSKVAAGGETGAVVGTSNAVTQDIFVWEYQGFTGTPTLDKVISSNSGAASVTTLSTGTTAATTDATEVAFALVGLSAAGNSITTPWTNSYVDDATRASTRLFIATKALSSTGTQETTLAWTTARKACAGLATFKDVSGATTYHGTASGGVNLAGTASGHALDHATSSGGVNLAGAAAGHGIDHATASGGLSIAGAAAGHVVPAAVTYHGTAAGGIELAGTAAGHVVAAPRDITFTVSAPPPRFTVSER